MKISADFLRLRVERGNMNNVETGNMNIYLVSNIYICMVFYTWFLLVHNHLQCKSSLELTT